ncbi:MAG: LamG domain-containing protein [Spirochaetales bacterium]|nr:LamG domain-containing protein [Spirochaetales bacterium]
MKTLYIFILSLVGVIIFSDTLYLSNGNSVKGSIVSLNDTLVKIETQNGILEVSKDKIVRGEFFGNGQEISGNTILEFLFDGKIKDSSGNAYPVKTKSIPYDTGVLNDEGGAIKSSGNGEYFYIENSKTISDIEEFTLAMYIFPEDTSENTFLISNWGNTYKDGKADGRFSLSVKNRNIAYFVVDSNGYYQSVFAQDVIELKKWNSVAIRFTKGELSIYVNGATVASNKISENSLLKGNWPLYFLTAKNGDDYKKYNFKGKLDKFMMLDSSLSDNELNLLFKL